MTLIAQRTVTGAEVRPTLRTDRRRRRLSSVIARYADRSRPHIVSVHRLGEALAPSDITVVLREEWKDRLVGPEDVIVIVYLPLGGAGGSGSSIALAVGAIALAVVAPYLVGALGAAGIPGLVGAGGALTLGGQVLASGIVMGGMALMSMAFKPKANKQQDTDDRPVYGVSGGGNLPRPGDRIPRLYGRCWTTPDLSQPDYFRYEGEDQILFKRMTITLGGCQIHRIRVGNQIMATSSDGVNFSIRSAFEGSQVEVVNPGEACSLVPRDVVSSSAVQGNALPRPDDPNGQWSPAFTITGPGVTINRIQVDISAPQGSILNFTNSKGAQEAGAPLGWEFQYRKVDDNGSYIGDWKLLTSEGQDRLSRRPLRFTRIVSVPEGRYAVRGRNLYNNTPRNARETNITNTLQWDGLRGYVPDTRRRYHVTELAIKVRSSPALAVNSFAEVQVEATGKVPVWNGSAWTAPQATRKAVWIYADVMRNASYGGAISDSAFDAETAKWYADTVGQFDTFDGVIRGPDSIWNVAGAVLFPLRAEPVQLGRLWSLVRDEPHTGRRHVITPRQIVHGTSGLIFDTDPDRGDAHLLAEYEEKADPRRPLQLPAVIYGNPSITPTRRKMFGVSSWDHAVHLARWLAAGAFFRRQVARFSTEHDGRIYKRGDRIAVDIWFSSNAKIASILSVSGQTLTLDRPVAYTAGDHIVLRDRSGREWGPVLLNGQGAQADKLVLNASSRATVEAQTGLPLTSVLAIGLMEETTVLIGPGTTFQRNYLVRSAKPSGRDRVDVEAVIDRQEVWDAIGAVPVPNPHDDYDPDVDILPPTNLSVTERLFNDGGTVRSAVTFRWVRALDQRALLTEVEYRIVPNTIPDVGNTDPDTVLVPPISDGSWHNMGGTEGTSFEEYDLPACYIDMRARSVYTALSGSVWVYLRNVPVLGLMAPPSDVTGFMASILNDAMRLTWNPVPDLHFSHYEIRFSPKMTGATWGTAVPLVLRTTLTTEQVPARVGTYLIKAVSITGIASRNAALIVSDVEALHDLNAVENLVQQPGFVGAKTNVFVNSELAGLQLDYTDDFFSRTNVFGVADWFLGNGGLAPEGTYVFAETLDLGDIYTSRLTAAVEAFGLNVTDDFFARPDVFSVEDFFMLEDPSVWDVDIEYRTTNDNPSGAPKWSDWQPFVIGDVSARAFQFRARLYSFEFAVTPVVTRLEVQIDMPDRILSGEDLAIPAAGRRVIFSPAYKVLKGLGITAQGLLTGDTYSITSKDATGFNIRFFSSSGTPVARTLDYVAVGYGRSGN